MRHRAPPARGPRAGGRPLRPVAIVKAGSTLPEVAARRGDFEDWIAAGLGLPGARLRVLRVCEDESLPEPSALSGAVVTGSSAMVTAREPWSERTAAWLRAAVAAGTPLLGICYGHQLLAHAAGGRVAPNPRGREVGTVEVELFAEGDALLGALPARARFQATHVESVVELPSGAVRLGASARDPHQAFRLGGVAWGIQFHPEFDADVMRGYLAGRRERLSAEGIDVDALIRAVEETPHGSAVLRRFAAIASGPSPTRRRPR